MEPLLEPCCVVFRVTLKTPQQAPFFHVTVGVNKPRVPGRSLINLTGSVAMALSALIWGQSTPPPPPVDELEEPMKGGPQGEPD